MNYTIRNCEENDLKDLVLLCAAHAEYEKGEFDPSGKVEALRSGIFDLPKRLNCWVVEVDGKIEGFSTYTFDYSTWDAASFLYMDCLFLNEKIRGKGVGTAIMKRIQAVAKEDNCVNIQWQTPEFNALAIKFYVGLGSVGKQKMRFFMKP
ncbi:acetyltransferase [Belliella baltica DSM 15883]|uniref:Acetyltransferase n=1 Tax=Belliella baltica (strain DSM 15883 / CIP 108006 / LMG 21964 / BA134) TaxID=866536 RepID=I3Z7F5_BELBD|nr:GNAT family N-acetyltransferase [Belliella baltica]AFL85173.1 acetyltransferase [Belliella baltica DSM 15883]